MAGGLAAEHDRRDSAYSLPTDDRRLISCWSATISRSIRRPSAD